MSKKFVEILLPLSLDNTFTYLANKEINNGDVVKVEFGKKQIWSVVVKILDKAPEFDLKKIKEILEIHPHISLSKNQLKFLDKLSDYNLATPGLVLRSMIGILNSNKTKKEPVPLQQPIKPEDFELKTLLPEQEEIFTNLQENTDPLVSLIDGVTGSGKTEIYFALIAKVLKEQKDAQTLILLPEIALTSQLLLRFRQQFGFEPALWHSKITPKQKREIFYGLNNGQTKVIIGARSALLLPFKRLKLIIVDEEHDSSYKQEDVFNFNARDMAILKSAIEQFPVILASATPSIESYNNAKINKYNYYKLEQRFGQQNDMTLVDLRQEKLKKNNFLSEKLTTEIAKNLESAQQTLLFLNRRGYAPVTMCNKCGAKYSCNNCDFNLVLHKTKKQLICHHCGHHEPEVKKCKYCGEEESIISVGIGVEKLAEEVALKFPTAKVVLATSDNLTSFEDAQKLVDTIINQEVDIIIGTQMIAKGYDFENVSLVGIVDIDSMLYSSEIRALEKAYQLLTQVTGRAGRGKIKGRVLIQSYNPENFLFKQIIKGKKQDFYHFEIANRQALEIPPFSKMAKFEISSFNANEAKSFAKHLRNTFPVNDKIETFGPAPAPIQRLKNRHHFLLTLKVQKQVNIQKLIKDVLSSLKAPTSIRVRVDSCL
ncbi:MAG: primosomal protein N' [Rickettsiales bacterium]|nr:primosomal protein N' [Rickettsiales bacterium]